MKDIDREVQATLCAISTTSSLVNKTGSWRFGKPLFIDRISPCNQQCPAGEDITGYMYLAGQGRFEDAWRLIMQENPFPAIMGRVCYHTCEAQCNRCEHDEAVSVNQVERFIGDYALEHDLRIKVDPPNMNKTVAVVGAGPAGLSAAYHLRLMGYRISVYDSYDLPGGLLRYGIPPYRLPKDIVDGEISRLKHMDIEFNMGIRLGKDLSWDEINRRADAVFIAIGNHRETELDIQGLDKKGVFRALHFLRDINLGKRYDLGEKVAVIGGGNSAIDCARVSRRLGAEVTIVYRRGEAEMPAYKEEIEMAREEGVRFLFMATPEEIYGGEYVTGIKLSKMALGEPDESGRRRPFPTGETFNFDCQNIIFAIGESIRTEDLPPPLSIEGKVISTDELAYTGHAKFFAGGDIIDIPHTVTHAIGSGKRAGVAIDRFLKGESSGARSLPFPKWGEKGNIRLGPFDDLRLFPRRRPISEVINYSELNPFYFDHRPRTKVHMIPLNDRLNSFKEIIESFTEEEVSQEARRCFICGSCTECGNCFFFCPDISVKKNTDGYGYVIDMDYCKGCGICVQECPRGAMKMEFTE